MLGNKKYKKRLEDLYAKRTELELRQLYMNNMTDEFKNYPGVKESMGILERSLIDTITTIVTLENYGFIKRLTYKD